jgi:hypothetical protein
MNDLFDEYVRNNYHNNWVNQNIFSSFYQNDCKNYFINFIFVN